MSDFSAVLVGINNYSGSPLRGCCTDVLISRDILVKMYNVPANQVRLVLDDRASKEAMIERLEWLVFNEAPNKMFYYSGHGAQIPIQNYEGAQEPDKLNELLCPQDFNWEDKYILDDQIDSILSKMKDEHHMTMIFDCCHSGSIDRGDFLCGCATPQSIPKSIPTPLDLMSRMSGSILSEEIQLKDIDLLKAFSNTVSVAKELPKNHTTTSKYNVSIITGCQDNQTSADAWVGDRYQGALSFALQSILIKNLTIDISTLRYECEKMLASLGYTQIPQLIASEANLNKPFIQV